MHSSTAFTAVLAASTYFVSDLDVIVPLSTLLLREDFVFVVYSIEQDQRPRWNHKYGIWSRIFKVTGRGAEARETPTADGGSGTRLLPAYK